MFSVIESGDDLTSILDKEALVLVNHQSTSDVPILMSSMYPKGVACGSMTWVMDYIFKFTNFGWISYFHEDFFICQVISIITLSRGQMVTSTMGFCSRIFVSKHANAPNRSFLES